VAVHAPQKSERGNGAIAATADFKSGWSRQRSGAKRCQNRRLSPETPCQRTAKDIAESKKEERETEEKKRTQS
jgi:hypothetical protein